MNTNSSPANIFLTNYCNQGCSFCYAQKLMSNKNISQELSIENFSRIISKMKNADVKNVKFLGGEPTLHSKFEEITNLALFHFDTIQLFTNCIFSKKIYSYLQKKGSRIHLTVNICTPGFQNNIEVRNLIFERIDKLSELTDIALSIIVDPGPIAMKTVERLDKKFLTKIKAIRFGLLNPVVGQKNQYTLTDFPLIGNNVIALITKLKKLQPNLNFVFDCGFTHCMFTKKQHRILDKNDVKSYYYGCFLNRHLKHYDIKTDLSVVSCYALSNKSLAHLGRESLKNAENKVFVEQYTKQVQHLLKMCQKCQFHGRGYHKCFGPCLGFRINQQK